ncbi:MAG: DegT/DnrJ/EryC1/StrS aminotransferase family protein [Gammaproteobacteria bacterium]|nr:DegT/DnrJ/EryC1/StrS aminotransferase family protein [Gammaproteobacteria bacterium]
MKSAPWPTFSEQEIKAVSQVLASGKVNAWAGQETLHFESEFAAYCGAPHALAVCNGSIALDVALRASGIKPGDEIIVTPRSYFASVSSVVMAGAVPVFADVDPDSQNLSVRHIEPCLSTKTRAILPVHLGGWPCNMPAIMQLAEASGLIVIEDCAQAHGARIAERHVGSFGDIATFSFCQDKIMTTGGEGGLLTFLQEHHWDAAWSLRDNGKCRKAVMQDDHPPGFRWVHDSFGSNYRMTEMQAAIGRYQTRVIEKWLAIRAAHAAAYDQAFRHLPGLRVVTPPADVRHAYYRYYMFLRPDALKTSWTRDRILEELRHAGVPGGVGSCPEIYREKAVVNAGYHPRKRLPNAVQLGNTSLALMLHPTMTEYHREKTIDIVTDVIKRATRN